MIHILIFLYVSPGRRGKGIATSRASPSEIVSTRKSNGTTSARTGPTSTRLARYLTFVDAWPETFEIFMRLSCGIASLGSLLSFLKVKVFSRWCRTCRPSPISCAWTFSAAIRPSCWQSLPWRAASSWLKLLLLVMTVDTCQRWRFCFPSMCLQCSNDWRYRWVELDGWRRFSKQTVVKKRQRTTKACLKGMRQRPRQWHLQRGRLKQKQKEKPRQKLRLPHPMGQVTRRIEMRSWLMCRWMLQAIDRNGGWMISLHVCSELLGESWLIIGVHDQPQYDWYDDTQDFSVDTQSSW